MSNPAGMTLLQMAQFVQGNIGTSADLPFAGPTTVVGANGQYFEFVNYIFQAYKALQLEQNDWRFRIRKGILNLFPGQNIYTLAQIQAQIPDYDDIAHLHFIDDSRYALVANLLTQQPLATTTVGAVTQSNDTTYVTVTNISTFSPENGTGNIVLVNGGANTITGPLQSVNGNVMGFATELLTVVGTPTSISPGSAVTYAGPNPAPDVTTQTFCFFYEYQNWRGWKDRQALPKGKPTYYTKDMNEALEVNPVPDVGYALFIDYKSALDVMPQTDTASPLYLPGQYHEIICWKAIMYWAINRENGAKYNAAKTEYDRIYDKLCNNQTPGLEVYLAEYYG